MLKYIILSCLLISDISLFPQTKIKVEFSTGLPFNIPLPLSISQNGEKEINLTAKFSSDPFAVPIYWDWRIGYYFDNSGWELESIHHKLFLENKPSEVGTFSISHGLNFITINHSWKKDAVFYRAGAGFILAHPESIIRNKEFPENGGLLGWGYYLTGPAIIIGTSTEVSLDGSMFANIELKLSAAYVSVPVNNGNADLYNVALHIVLGLGYDFNM